MCTMTFLLIRLAYNFACIFYNCFFCFFLCKSGNPSLCFTLYVYFTTSTIKFLSFDCWFFVCMGQQADKILELAGSNGRSWSTSYSRRPTSKATNPLSHHSSLSAAEIEKEKVQKLLWGLSQNQNGIATGTGSRHT